MYQNTAGNMPDEIAREWEFIRSSVEQLFLEWTFHKELSGNTGHVEFMMRELPRQFLLINRSMKKVITLQIGMLVDDDQRTLSFHRFLKTIKQSCPAAPSSQFESALAKIVSHCRPILRWRHSRFAHANRKTVLTPEPGILPEVDESTFEQALAMFRQLLSDIHGHFNGTDSPMHFPSHSGDADKLMHFLQTGYEAENADLRSDLFS